MAKVLNTIRTNWKKSVFFSAVGAYGINYGNNKYNEHQIMKRYCLEAKEYGEKLLPSFQNHYNVTVILNPAASKGDAKSKYENYCAPVLHLAGFKVSVIRTEESGQARDIMEIMKDADAVLVAGGDGTVMEAVTGLMRRSDAEKMGKTVPVGVLPVGSSNDLARALFPDIESTSWTDVELMAASAMSCVKQLLRPMDVVQVKNISEDENIKGKRIFGMTELQLGAFRDAHERLPKYWYWAGLKKAMAYVFGYTTSAKKLLWNVDAKLEFASLDTKVEDKPVETPEEKPTRTWWNYIWPSATPAPLPTTEPLSQSETKLAWRDEGLYSGSEIRIRTPNVALTRDKSPEKCLKVDLGPYRDDIGLSDFVSEGWRREKRAESESISVKTENVPALRFFPSEETYSSEDGIEKYFNLDKENIEVRGPLEISLLQDKVAMFCSSQITQPIPKWIESNEIQTSGSRWWKGSGRAKPQIQTATLNRSL